MCDEDRIIRWAREGLNRRQFGALGTMAAIGVGAAACAPMGANGDGTVTLPAMAERNVSFATPDGTMDAFWVTPASNPAPAVILWPDIAGLRPAKYDMARRLAGRGYSVLAVNPYYRDVSGQIWDSFAEFAANEGFAKAREFRQKHSADAIMSDAKAIVGWLDTQAEVDRTKGIGTQGYCMGGPFTMWSAAAVPSRIKAAASFHGGGLVRDDNPQSPHRLMEQMQAALLIAIAQDDDAEAP
ncbi:MAG: dienelactone hydrolase family protein, partial [Pontixanthobacter sp.]